MSTLHAVVQGGRLEITVPDDWPDGTEVEIRASASQQPPDDDIMSAEEIAATLAAMRSAEYIEASDAEYANWENDLRRILSRGAIERV